MLSLIFSSVYLPFVYLLQWGICILSIIRRRAGGTLLWQFRVSVHCNVLRNGQMLFPLGEIKARMGVLILLFIMVLEVFALCHQRLARLQHYFSVIPWALSFSWIQFCLQAAFYCSGQCLPTATGAVRFRVRDTSTRIRHLVNVWAPSLLPLQQGQGGMKLAAGRGGGEGRG